jgi:glycosyltransferase involved in cell wall biosynthesis
LSTNLKLVYFRSKKLSDRSHRILHISPLPPPWGGVAANLSFLLNSDQLSIYDMAVLNIARQSYFEDVGLNKKLWHISRLIRGFSIYYNTLQAIRTFKPDIVQIQSAGPDFSVIRDMLLIPLIRRRVRYICFHQHFWADPAKLNGPQRLYTYVYKKCIPKCDALLMSTPLHIEQAAQLIPVDKAHYFPNTCIPPKNRQNNRSQNGEVVQVVYIGRLSYPKGTYDLIEAIKILKETSMPFRFVLVGIGETPEDEKRITGFIAKHELGNYTTLTGRVSEKQKWEILLQSNMMVFPSHAELLPVTLIEGLAAGLPIITTSVDYLPRLIVDGKNGLVVPPRSPEILSKAILKLGQDREAMKNMGEENFRKFQDEFAIDVIAGKLHRIYDNLLSRPQ